MSKKILPFACALLFLAGCGNEIRFSNSIVSERYVHKFGHTVSKQEWNERSYPGQVITSMSNGVTISASYENRTLHGPTTHTFPNSQIVQYFYLYNEGNLVKEAVYDTFGIPIKERVQLSPHRYTITKWYGDGTPMSVEDFADEELLEGEYFTVNNEVEARVEKGNGNRIIRDPKGLLLSKDNIKNGYIERRESLYASGTPASIIHYSLNQLHGEKRTFSPTGEPIVIEEWLNGQLHGKSVLFQNGIKKSEIHYLYGTKSGPETHYLDGNNIAQQILWEHDKRHGPTTYYIEGNPQMEWWYEGKKITQKRYEELDRLDQMITQMNDQ